MTKNKDTVIEFPVRESFVARANRAWTTGRGVLSEIVRSPKEALEMEGLEPGLAERIRKLAGE